MEGNLQQCWGACGGRKGGGLWLGWFSVVVGNMSGEEDVKRQARSSGISSGLRLENVSGREVGWGEGCGWGGVLHVCGEGVEYLSGWCASGVQVAGARGGEVSIGWCGEG